MGVWEAVGLHDWPGQRWKVFRVDKDDRLLQTCQEGIQDTTCVLAHLHY